MIRAGSVPDWVLANPQLSPEDELSMFRIMRDPTSTPEQSQRARDRLVGSCIKLAFKHAAIAVRHTAYLVDRQDLEQRAVQVILESLNRFDPSKGTRFSTYIFNRIPLDLKDYVSELGEPIRLASHAKKALRRILRAQAAAGRELTAAERLGASGLSERAYTAHGMDSLPEMLTTDGWEGELPILAADSTEDEAVAAVDSQRALHALYSALRALPDDERDLVVLMYGLGDTEAISASEAARQMGVSQRTVLRLHKTALARLHNMADEHNLTPAG